MSQNVQAQNVDFALHTLGWKSFQDLSLTVVREVFGQTAQAFNSSKDGGRDGAFYGIWKPSAQAELSGSFTFQCKFSSRANSLLKFSSIEDELDKAKKLASNGLCKNYILITNYSVPATVEAEIRKYFMVIPGIEECLVFGKEWITQQIRECARLRMHVPRIYGLGDLSQILDERVYEQAKEIVFSMKDTLSKFVMTDPYHKSVDALLAHGFVILIGEAASGKSTIAASLAVAAADHWKAPTIKIVDPQDFKEHWNPHEKKQFFWIDDAFGAAQFQIDRTQQWNHLLPLVSAAIKNGARIVMTSRDYIFNAATHILKMADLPVFEISRVVIKVQELSKNEREQILYNHIKLGNQSQEVKSRLKPFLSEIAAHEKFSPEIARRLGNSEFTRNLIIYRESLHEYVSNPKEFLKEIIRTLDSDSRAALGILFMRGGRIKVDFSFTDKEKEVIEIMSATNPKVRDAFRSLDGSFIHRVQSEGLYYWAFTHPTISDAYSSLISTDGQLLELYLDKTPVDQLIQEITCGDVDLQGQKVIVPKDKYSLMIKRLAEIREDGKRLHFLCYRCDKDFLQNFIQEDMKQDLLRIYPFLSACSELRLLSRLHELSILPDEWRKEAVQKIVNIAIETPDSDFLSLAHIRSLFTDEEFKNSMDRVKVEFIPNIDSIIKDWKYNCDKDEAEEYFGPLESTLREYRDYFKDENPLLLKLEAAIHAVNQVKEEIIGSRDDNYDKDESLYADKPAAKIYTERSIFDDVDEGEAA